MGKKVKLVSIGSSKDVRILRLAPTRNLREGWDAAFEKMAKANDDSLLIPDNLSHPWDEAEWRL
jgi:hypothetical protein